MSRRRPDPIRRAPHVAEHAASARLRDRIASRPLTLAALHRWLTDGYALEAPARLHDRDVADDGAPDHTGEAKGYLGMTDPPSWVTQTQATDWRRVACRTDDEGYYVTPMRCAIARVGDPDRRQLLGGLACNLLTPLDVTRAQDIPDWCAGDVMYRALSMLWDVYTDRPIPRRGPTWVEKSDSQRAAEEAA